MKFILLLILTAIAIYFLYLYFSNEQTKLKNKLIFLTRYNEELKKELCKNKKKNLSAKFSNPEVSSGILNENINIYIAPIDNSSIINSTSAKMQVNIIDECTIYDITWLYINLPSASNINCHGWVKKNDFSMLCSNSHDISPISSDE